jgi:hypothetical protein
MEKKEEWKRTQTRERYKDKKEKLRMTGRQKINKQK